MLSGRALAVVVLGRALLRAALRRLFRERTGLPLFHDNYDADRLPPISADERASFTTFSRCIACGRCDIGESERMIASNGAYPGLMAVVMASSRSMPDFDAAARALAFVPDEVLVVKTRVCPTAVPFMELARFVRPKSQQMLDAPGRSIDGRAGVKALTA
jgi:succinate dehydrogenase/fumarate reductase-like Fe-S protein